MSRYAHVLIADDENHIRDGIALLFSDDYCVTFDHAADGLTAMHLLRSNRYDLVICDGMLPEKHGDEILTEIRSGAFFDNGRLSGTPARTPVILITGAANGRLDEAFAHHAFVLEKPLNVELLRIVFRGYLSD